MFGDYFKISLLDSNFSSNTADLGGSLSLNQTNQLIVTNCIFNNNFALTDGGSIRIL